MRNHYPGSTTDRAATIRGALKARGITSRQVSVRADYYSMGSSIRIAIKDPAVPSALVKQIAEPHESIHRDHTGEILSGGNRFVDVNYTSEALEALAAPYLERVSVAHSQIRDNYLIPVEGTAYMVGGGHHGNGCAVWHKDSGHVCETWTVEEAAKQIAVRTLNATVPAAADDGGGA